MNDSTLENFLSQGFSLNKISKLTGIPVSTLSYRKKVAGLESKFKRIKDMSRFELSAMGKQNTHNLGEHVKKRDITLLDWKAIQYDHDHGLSYEELCKKHSIYKTILAEAKKIGLFFTVSEEEKNKRISIKSSSRSHSPETKVKISEKRKNWLKNNPDKHYWSFAPSPFYDSKPCSILKERLKNEGIFFIEEYKPLLHKDRFFSIDVYLPQFSLGIEVNGRQHYTKDGEGLTEYYQNRHDLIEKEGIKLLEIKSHKFFSKRFMEELIRSLKES